MNSSTANSPIRVTGKALDKGSSSALMFIVNTAHKIKLGAIASAIATPFFNLGALIGRGLVRVAKSKPLAPVRFPFKVAQALIGRPLAKAWRSPKLKFLTTPINAVAGAVAYTVKDFFKEAPKPAFFTRAFKTALVVGVFAVGLPMALGMGLSVAQMAAVAALQIPLNIFQKGLEKRAKEYLPTDDLNRETVTKYRKQLLILCSVAAVTATALALSPWLRLAASGLVLSAAQNLVQDKSKDLAKEKAKEALSATADPATAAAINEPILAPFAALTPTQRREIFERLKQDFSDDFSAVAGNTTPATPSAPSPSPVTKPPRL